MKTFLTQYLDISLVLLTFLLYTVLWAVKKQELKIMTGANANVLFKATRPIQQYFGVLEKLMKAALVLILAAHFLLPRDYLLTTRLFGQTGFTAKVIGSLIVIIGLSLCRLAQVTIGKSWRVGIDENAKPGLVTKGIYSLIRNPTYSGLYLLCAGVFIILPSVLVSYWILVFVIMMEFQVRCEEEYLESQYGSEFQEYKTKTKRYIPFVY